jgi:hypothetical protein
MLRTVIRALLPLAIGTLAAWGADNSIGTWKVNIAKSNYAPGSMPLKSYTTVREAVPGGVKVSLGGERVDGVPIKATYTAKFDGTAAAVAGSGTPYDSISIKQVDANTFTYEIKQSSNKYRATGRTVVSSDGKTMTTTAKGTDADGNPMGLTLVFEKQ